MTIVHLSHCDISGGANRAGFRIFEAQWDAGMDVSMAVAIKLSDHPGVREPEGHRAKLMARVRSAIENSLRKKLRLGGEEAFSMNVFPGSIIDRRLVEDADVVHLHFLGGSPFTLNWVRRSGKPVVWTLHDMWPMTAGEHYRPDDDLAEYVGGDSRIARFLFRRKQRACAAMDLRIVCPSRWLERCARQSRILGGREAEVIPYAINLERYRPTDRGFAREALGLPKDRPLVLFGADRMASVGSRKGFDLLMEALNRFQDDGGAADLVLFGQRDYPSGALSGFTVHLPGNLSDDTGLALLYSAADLFVAPSRQDNLPNTVIESLACGTPVAAFEIGGMPDMIEHDRTGYLARPFDAEDLAAGIRSLLERQQDNPDGLREACRRRATELFSPGDIARAYASLYKECLDGEQRDGNVVGRAVSI